jgi:hypothetical protein
VLSQQIPIAGIAHCSAGAQPPRQPSSTVAMPWPLKRNTNGATINPIVAPMSAVA